jgi:hypothetical protein
MTFHLVALSATTARVAEADFDHYLQHESAKRRLIYNVTGLMASWGPL